MANIEKYQSALDEFKRIYLPAKNIAEADEYFTTAELYDKFIYLTYDKSVKKKRFHELLIENGFSFVYFLDGFVWPVVINRQ
jgi:hypothetical protein